MVLRRRTIRNRRENIQVEWRKRYRKYRPLRQPATCNDCHKKTITSAYHKICTPCARERRVCPWCCTKGRPRETLENGEEGDFGEGGAEEGDEEPAGAEGKEVGNDGKRQAEAGGEDRGKAAADDDSMQQEEEGDPAGAGAAGVGGGGKSVAFASGSRNSDSDGAAGAAAGSGASDAVAMDDS